MVEGTQERAPERAHEERQRLLAAIAEQLPDAVIFADREGLIRHWNPGAEAVFGFSAAEVMGQSLDVIIPERLRAPHWAAYHRAIESGHTRGGNEVRTTRALHKDGRKLYVDFSFGLVLDESGVALGSMALGRDVTKRYEELKALRERIAAIDAAKSRG